MLPWPRASNTTPSGPSDFRVASVDAHFWFPEFELGRAISQTVIDTLVEVVGLPVARDMVLTARRYTAGELAVLHLASCVVPGAEVMEVAQTMAASLDDAIRLGGTAHATAKARLTARLLSHWTESA